MMKTTYIARMLGALGLALCFIAKPALATTYSVSADDQNLIGSESVITTGQGETLATIASKHDIGVNEIADANPGILSNAVLPPGLHIRIPTEFLLPNLPHKGIVINLPEMRMYYYPKEGNGTVMTFPIGIGRVGKMIPITRTAVTHKVKDPIWIPPEDIRAFNEQQGIKLPHIMPAGPDNPLGPYAIYLKVPTYLIHSTIYPESIGRRASFGCIRMHEGDIKEFFPLVTPGTDVVIVDMPTKVGWAGNNLILEAHEPLEEHSTEFHATFDGMINAIASATEQRNAFIDWQLVGYLAEQRDGTPHEIGFNLK